MPELVTLSSERQGQRPGDDLECQVPGPAELERPLFREDGLIDHRLLEAPSPPGRDEQDSLRDREDHPTKADATPLIQATQGSIPDVLVGQLTDGELESQILLDGDIPDIACCLLCLDVERRWPIDEAGRVERRADIPSTRKRGPVDIELHGHPCLGEWDIDENLAPPNVDQERVCGRHRASPPS